jgi:hypothetical protein
MFFNRRIYLLGDFFSSEAARHTAADRPQHGTHRTCRHAGCCSGDRAAYCRSKSGPNRMCTRFIGDRVTVCIAVRIASFRIHKITP